MAPIVDYEKWREQQLQDPEFVAELEKLEPGYQIARLRLKLGLTQAKKPLEVSLRRKPTRRKHK